MEQFCSFNKGRRYPYKKVKNNDGKNETCRPTNKQAKDPYDSEWYRKKSGRMLRPC
jgi:hypothetical protein